MFINIEKFRPQVMFSYTPHIDGVWLHIHILECDGYMPVPKWYKRTDFMGYLRHHRLIYERLYK